MASSLAFAAAAFSSPSFFAVGAELLSLGLRYGEARLGAPTGVVRPVHLPRVQLEVTAGAQRDQVAGVIASAFWPRDKVMALEVFLGPAGYADGKPHHAPPARRR